MSYLNNFQHRIQIVICIILYHLNINLTIIWSLMKLCQDKYSITYIDTMIIYLLFWCAYIKTRDRLSWTGEVISNIPEARIILLILMKGHSFVNSELLYPLFNVSKMVSTLKKKKTSYLESYYVFLNIRLFLCQRKVSIVTS